MKTIIINGQRELAELPELWYTDGTDEANEWNVAVWTGDIEVGECNYVGNHPKYKSDGAPNEIEFKKNGNTYITQSEFMRLVYEPWKEKVKLPETYEELCSMLTKQGKAIIGHTDYFPKHIQACAKLTNIMNFANDAFEGDGQEWNVWSCGEVIEVNRKNNPIRFTSFEAAEWAYKTFPEIFKAYWNV